MMVFEGELSLNCKRFIINKSKKIIFFSTGIVSLIMGVGLLIVMFSTKLWLLLSAFPAILIAPLILPLSCSSSKDQETYIPNRIYVDIEDETIGAEGKRFHYERGFENIKEIVDYGLWYDISFLFGYKSISFVIQKDLITQGTIEEFEKIFHDKIKVLND